ncbi:caprin-1b [Aplochiton taeniatus]
MPSAMNGNRTVRSASPDVESTPGSGSLGGQSPGVQTEVMKQVVGFLEKKVRNMEKKKCKLDDYQAKKNKGERLNQDQLEALSKFPEVTHNLDFAQELQKSYLALGQDIQKAGKKATRREQLQREEVEQKRLKTVLELQFLLDRLGEDAVRQDLRQGDGGAALLTAAELTALDDFYKLVGPERDPNIRLTDQYDEASLHLFELLEAKDKAVAGTTYKTLKETLDRVLLSGYFDRTQSGQNGVCEEQEEGKLSAAAPAPAPAVPLDSQEQQCGREAEIVEEYTEPVQVEATEFVNRQFIPDFAYNSNEKEQVDDWTKETEAVGGMQPQNALIAPSPAALEPQPAARATPTPPANPVVRKQVVQDLMAQMQGPYNFMQDSMLEFDGQHIDPAIVSAQPMMRAQNMDVPKMEDPPVHSESCLSQPTNVPVQPESTHVPAGSTPTPATPQSSHTTDPRPPADSNPIQTSVSSSPEQPPPSTALPLAQVFPAASKSPHSGGINVNAAPFQSMQMVFNLNAPVPPASAAKVQTQASQFQDSYSQGFSSQTEDLGEQTEMQSEQLAPSGRESPVDAFQDQSLSSSGGHQQPPAQGPGFGRQAQSFYNSRGMVRGGPRNARGVVNGYRGSGNGFRGGYDGYRPPFANTPNSGYGQPQFNTSRDYSNGNYHRDGYQQNYKRGAVQGSRGVSRGNAQAMRS